MCLQFLIILPSSSGLKSEALSISVVSVFSLTGSSTDSLKIKIINSFFKHNVFLEFIMPTFILCVILQELRIRHFGNFNSISTFFSGFISQFLDIKGKHLRLSCCYNVYKMLKNYTFLLSVIFQRF